MSDLEKRWVELGNGLMSVTDMGKLINTLRRERDCWRDNAVTFEKENQKLQKLIHIDDSPTYKPKVL